MATKTVRVIHPSQTPCDCRWPAHCIYNTLEEVETAGCVLGQLVSIANPPEGYPPYASFQCLGNGTFQALQMRTRLEGEFRYNTGSANALGTGFVTPAVPDGDVYEFIVPFNTISYNVNNGFTLVGNGVQIASQRDAYHIQVSAVGGPQNGDPANEPTDGMLQLQLVGLGAFSSNASFDRIHWREASYQVGNLAEGGETLSRLETDKKAVDLSAGDLVQALARSTMNRPMDYQYVQLEISGYDLDYKVVTP